MPDNFFDLPEDFLFDLQRFASAESEGRSEKATEHKKRKARDEGKVPLSKELPAAIITLICFVVIYMLAGYCFKTITDVFKYIFGNLSTLDITNPNLFYDAFLIPFLKIFLPIAVTAFLISAFSNYLQIGLRFTTKAIKPDFTKLAPNVFKYLQNQVFSVNGFFTLIKSIVKIAIIGIVSYITIKDRIEELINMLFVESIFYSFVLLCKITFSIIIKATIILLVFSVVDILFVRWHYEESLKMKKEEVKEEYKELYGDPNVKSRLRQMYNNLLNQKKMLDEVPKADVVITNPTHYAVSLYYDKYTDEAPRVTAKGKDAFAVKIKEIAKENGVFMFENVALARALYSDVEVNDIIPKAMYGLVVNAYKLAHDHKERQKAAV